MHLLRCLVYIEATLGFHLVPLYIRSKANHFADALSRNDVSYFLSKVPAASRIPTLVSGELLQLLLEPQADWTCPAWRPQFKNIFRPV